MKCIVCEKEMEKTRSQFCCKKCAQHYYYIKNKEQRTEYKKQYYEEHKEEYKERKNEWLDQNREKWNQYQRKRRKELKET